MQVTDKMIDAAIIAGGFDCRLTNDALRADMRDAIEAAIQTALDVTPKQERLSHNEILTILHTARGSTNTPDLTIPWVITAIREIEKYYGIGV
jgi:hypothetical protein